MTKPRSSTPGSIHSQCSVLRRDRRRLTIEQQRDVFELSDEWIR